MKTISRGFALSMLIIAWPVVANDAPPSDASIQELLYAHNMMAEMQTLMRPVTQRMIRIRTEAEQEIKALPARK
jgi:hypothetical protein